MKNTIANTAFANPQHFRNMLLQHCIIAPAKKFTGKTFICVSLTRFCPVGCKFCFFKSAPVYKTPTIEDAFSNENLVNFINFANNINLGYLLISGGGEPMLQRDAIIELIEKITSERIVLVTSANWAKTMRQAESYVADIDAALARRKSETMVTIRVSCDVDHNSSIGYEPVINLIRLFEKNYKNHPHLELKLHGLTDDPSIDIVINRLSNEYTITRNIDQHTRISDGKSVIKIVPKQEILSFNDYVVPVGYAKIFYSNLKVDLYKDVSKSIEVYQEDLFISEDGNSSVVGNINGEQGLDFWVNYNGNVTTWGNQFLDNLLNVHEDSHLDIINKTLQDPAALSFIEKGANYRDKIVNEVNNIAVIRSKSVNIRDYTGALMFDEARTRLYYTVRVIQDYIAEGRVSQLQLELLPNEVLELISCSKDTLYQTYQDSSYTIVEQITNQEFNKHVVKDHLEWIKLGHYKLTDMQVNKLLAYYNSCVTENERIDDLSQLTPDLAYQNARMTEYLTHIKSSLKLEHSGNINPSKIHKRQVELNEASVV